MTKIDLKDRRILYQLDLNSRQSLTQVGKKVGLKKDVVSYRIKKLEDEGVIKSYWTLIDTYKLGYDVFRFYLVFQYATPDIKEKIIKYFIDDKHTCVVSSLIGRYDLVVFLWVKDMNDFYNFWERLLDNYGDYFAEKIFSIYVRWYTYRNSYLLGDEFDKADRNEYEITGGQTRVNIDDVDYQILNELAENARMPLIELAEKIGCSSQSVNYRIKNLVEQDVIQAFRPGIDLSKLGLKQYKVDILLKEHTKRKNIMNNMKYNPNLIFIGTSAGVSDLELEFAVESEENLHQIMEDINIKYPGVMRRYDFISASKSHKLRFIPEE